MRTFAVLPLVRTFLGPVAAALLLASANAAMVVFDDFSGSSMNPNLWTLDLRGYGPVVDQSMEMLNVFLPSSSSAPRSSGFLGGYVTQYSIGGDFDIRVDFLLIDWPVGNGVRVGLHILTKEWNAIQRLSRVYAGSSPSQETYTFSNPSGGLQSIATDDMSGTLRMTRVGDAYSGYIWNWPTEQWLLIGSGTPATGYDFVNVGIAAWSDASLFGKQDVRIAFDDFQGTYEYSTYTPIPESDDMVWVIGCMVGLMIGFEQLRKMRRAER